MEPLAVIPLQYSNVAAGVPPRQRMWLGIQSAIVAVACAIAWILIPASSYGVLSVVVSGPVIFILGLMLFLLALRARAIPYLILAAAHCAICLLFFMLVWRLDWSPAQATRPFEIMGAIYLAASILLTLWAWFSRSNAFPKHRANPAGAGALA